VYLPSNEVAHKTAQLLTEKKIVGWFQGRAEFWPSCAWQSQYFGGCYRCRYATKTKFEIKFREGFRPFAPIVLAHKAKDYFELDGESPYMLLIAPVIKAKRVEIDSFLPRDFLH
jgi:carbamoyltransferase